MGLALEEVKFNGQAPPLARIVRKAVEIGGLEITTEESSSTVRGNLFDLNARLAFAEFPKDKIELRVYRDGEVEEHLERDSMSENPTAKVTLGPDETQTVYLRGSMSQDLSLFFVTLMALEALGGTLLNPITDEARQEFPVPVVLSELKTRRKKIRRQMLLAIPLTIAMLLLYVPWKLLTLPITITKARRRFRAPNSGRTGE